jgi:hypothetical protein
VKVICINRDILEIYYKIHKTEPYAPAAFTPRKYSWYSFLLEVFEVRGDITNRFKIKVDLWVTIFDDGGWMKLA